jgi:proline racemase
MIHDSIIGSRFEGRVLDVIGGAAYAIVSTEVEGDAFKTAECTFFLDPRDQLGTGFLLR